MNIMDYRAWVAVSASYFFFINMLLERGICVVILCFFALGSATICSDDRDCDTWSGESCCSDSVCRKTCSFNCHSDYDCGTGEVCCDGGDCSSACPSTSPPWTLAPITYCSFDSDCDTDEVCCDGDCLSVCPSTWSGASIVGAVFGTIVFFSIVISIVACYFCTWCPYYRYRSPGTVIVSQQVPYQQFVSTTHTTMSSMQQVPPPVNCNQPPPPGYNQAPPPYPSYPQQPAQQHPPPTTATGQPPMAPKVSA